MSNIPGLNEKESEWVSKFMRATCNHEKFTEKPPSERALDCINTKMEEIMEKKSQLG